MESVFISRFTMNNIAPKLQKCWTHKIAFKIISKMLKQPNFFLELAFYTSEGHTCKVLSFYDFWFTFNDKFCSPYPIVDFYAYLITKIGNRNLKSTISNSLTLNHTCKVQNRGDILSSLALFGLDFSQLLKAGDRGKWPIAITPAF